ncbi:unnamed protein product [Symbiodinium pilosum]|uniref:Uncharacterized protein n=1 Tax=Symbiodinium pilosum TaxID=2952 RepID=A0A812VUG7_SYMPI|nr:unnamed protein product [Symbiodinium pilosum]
MQDELLKVSKRLDQLEREKQQLAESGLNVLARCSSKSRTRLASSSPNGATPQPVPPETSPAGTETAADMDKHPWLLADGRLVTAHLQGENLALKRAVMKARREIDELLKGRAETEARARALKEENSAAAEALRRYTSTWLPQDWQKPKPSTAASAEVAGGKHETQRSVVAAHADMSSGASGGADAVPEVPEIARGAGASGDHAAGLHRTPVSRSLDLQSNDVGMDYLISCGLPVHHRWMMLRMPYEVAGRGSQCDDKQFSDEVPQDLSAMQDSAASVAKLQTLPPQQRRLLLFFDVDGVLHPLQVRVLEQTQKVDTSHCFQRTCMQQLRRVVLETGAQLILSSSWRKFESTREMLLENLAQHGLSFREWTTVAGGESNDARVDQILTFVTASDVGSWAVVDDEDLAPSSTLGSEGMMRSLFRQHFVRTDASQGLDSDAADALIKVLNDESDED